MKSITGYIDEFQAARARGKLKPDDVASALSIQSRAKRSGRNGYPSKVMAPYDQNEQVIITHFDTELRTLRETQLSKAHAVLQRINAISFRDLAPVADRKAKTAINQASQQFTDQKTKIERLYNNKLEAEEFFEEFRNERNLGKIVPRIRDRNFTFKVYAILFALMSAEIIINTLLFQSYSTVGFGETLIKVIFFSIVNVAMSYGLGFFAKYVRFNSTSLKLVGAISSFLWFFITIFSNVLFSSYRDAQIKAETIGPDAIGGTVREIIKSPWQIESVESVMLLILGIAFAGFAFVKGARDFPDYPGLSIAYKNKNDSAEKYEVECKKIMHQIDHIFSTSEVTLKEIEEECHNYLELVNSETANLYKCKNEFLIRSDEIQSALNACLQIYRNENIYARRKIEAHTPPPYFGDTYFFSSDLMTLEGVEIPDNVPKADQLLKKFQEISTVVEGLLTQLEAKQTELHESVPETIKLLEDAIREERERDNSWTYFERSQPQQDNGGGSSNASPDARSPSGGRKGGNNQSVDASTVSDESLTDTGPRQNPNKPNGGDQQPTTPL